MTVYTTSWFTFVILVIVWLNELTGVGLSEGPETFVFWRTVQVYNVPLGTILLLPLAALYVNVSPLQISRIAGVIIEGFGWTFTSIVKSFPLHNPTSPEIGVIV